MGLADNPANPFPARLNYAPTISNISEVNK
jgi:hypothetical protein